MIECEDDSTSTMTDVCSLHVFIRYAPFVLVVGGYIARGIILRFCPCFRSQDDTVAKQNVENEVELKSAAIGQDLVTAAKDATLTGVAAVKESVVSAKEAVQSGVAHGGAPPGHP